MSVCFALGPKATETNLASKEWITNNGRAFDKSAL
jgi:hypothetical protein